MTYSDQEFGRDLLAQLDAGYDPVRIARWTYVRFLESGERSDTTHEFLIDLFTMEEGEELHIPEEQLRATADRFIASPCPEVRPDLHASTSPAGTGPPRRAG